MEFNSQTAIAFARLLVSLALSVCTFFGWALDADFLFNIILTAVTLILFIYTWWKNNNVTIAAQESQLVLNQIKQAEKDAQIVDIQVAEVVKEVMAAIAKASTNQSTK